MEGKERRDQEDIYSKILRAGRRTYFFDVRSTRANDYYLTITESKKFTNDDGSFHYKKHKIYLYKEDFEGFRDMLQETTDFILNEKGDEIITEAQHNGESHSPKEAVEAVKNGKSSDKFTDVSFDDI
ncbi:MAG: PUR family DNA/RNA-binding protein [Flavobacteriales bacterium]|nr:PUR family DNA/RNA-binding protein [Flavobacteriales bacterium]